MNGPNSRLLVVVDGYSSGGQLPTVMAELGWRCVHVKSTPEVLAYYLAAYRRDAYVGECTFDGDFEKLVEQVRAFEPQAVMPGTETGVILADRLAAALGLPGNDPALSVARRNKFEMHECLAKAGLRCMDHFLASDADALVAWARCGKWPVVAKPPASAGSDSVTFCADEAELRAVFHRLHGTTNQMGEKNDHVLAQRLLTGQEYFINGISGNGTHVITEIWRTEKIRVPGGGLIFDKSVLLDPVRPEMQTIVAYCRSVFEALGIRHGATHTEIMVDAEGTPTLIECASRLSGGLVRGAPNYAVGMSQLDLVGQLVARGPGFVENLDRADHTHRAALWQVQFISDQTGVVSESRYQELISSLKSKYWIQRAPKVGDKVTRTVDLFSSPGIVFMSHSDPAVLAADYEQVREWERKHMLFSVAPA
jgi:L-amino acid ligase